MSKTSTSATRLETSAAKVCAAVRAARHVGESVGLVPTMGALHEGHFSLIEASLAECDKTVVSIFVNPTQFGPNEDFESYPRTLERDFQLLAERGCWLVFAPSAEEVYREGHATYVEVGSVAKGWEGASRPDHFRGVATVVLKLFQMVPAARAYFGQKDYQQLLVIRQMVADLNLPIEICACPIVRESGGLAKSSRNAYLSPEEHEQAGIIWQSLQLAEALVAEGETNAAVILDKMKRFLATARKVDLEYLALFEEGTVREIETLDGPAVVAIAARVGQTRLIDNQRVQIRKK